MTAAEVREKAASLVEQHAARLGMDSFAAGVLVRAIQSIPIDEEADDAA